MNVRASGHCFHAFAALIGALALGTPATSRAEFGAVEEECPKAWTFAGKAPPQDVERGCVDNAGRRQGVWTRWWPNGSKWREAVYKDGKLNGPARAWRPDGTTFYNAEYKNGFLNGNITVYYANGRIKVQGAYTFGKPNGRWVAYKDDGTAVGQLLFDAGKVRPRSKGTPQVADYMPKRLRADALRAAAAKAQLLHDVSRKLVREGRSPTPTKLQGEKATEFAKQSKWLVATGQKLELHARTIELLSGGEASGCPASSQLGADERKTGACPVRAAQAGSLTGRRRTEQPIVRRSHSFAVPSSLPRLRSNVPSGSWPALRAISRTRQSEKPSDGLRR
jgi:hypothetical protein